MKEPQQAEESQEPVRIPTWDQLCQASFDNAPNPNFIELVEGLRSKPRRFLHGLGRVFTYVTQHDPSFRKFLSSSWEEIVDIIFTQVADNSALAKNPPDALEPVSFESLSKVQRKFQQQPCSRITARRRVAYANDLLGVSGEILLIGDDDLVGVELARAGFKNITIVDIDKGVLEQIESIGRQEGLDFKLFQHDIRQPLPTELGSKDYQLVFLDPYYSLEGIEMFLTAAQTLTKDSNDPYFFLSIHLLSLMRSGLGGLEDLLGRMGLELVDFKRSFNYYPIPTKTRNLISFVNRTIMSSPGLRTSQFSYFLSDALLLRRSHD